MNQTLLCSMCGEPGTGTYTDCTYRFGGGYQPLCDWCEEVDELMWDAQMIYTRISEEIIALRRTPA